MATHSSILAWRIPRTEESGGLQSMRSQKVRQSKMTGQRELGKLLRLLFSLSVMINSFATLWTVAHQAPLSMGFSRQEY